MIDFFSAHHGLNNTNTDTFVIFSGGSAGGIGAFTNYEFVQSKLPFASVIGAPVGGFVPDVTWYNGTYSEVPVVDARTPAFKAHNKLYQAYYPPLCADLSYHGLRHSLWV